MSDTPDLREQAHKAIDSGQAFVIYNMSVVLPDDGVAIREHKDGSVTLQLFLPPGSSKHLYVLGSDFLRSHLLQPQT